MPEITKEKAVELLYSNIPYTSQIKGLNLTGILLDKILKDAIPKL